MPPKSHGIDTQNTSPKELIRRDIRHALSDKSTRKYPDMDLSRELFDPIEKIDDCFVHNFRSLGGKFIPCAPEDFCNTLVTVLKQLNYKTVFCPDKELSALLKEHRIPLLDTFLTNDPAEAALFFSDTLIARNGSIVFKQEYTSYPTIKHLAKEILIVARYESIVPDLKDALSLQNAINGNSPTPLLEIIAPQKPEIIDGEEHFGSKNQRFFLFLIC
ncbi:LUD domain-containing protein [Bacteroidales bacterium OttesenSCG-928-B11]|nr:LUD domain-containing protein [Bacteroidales bacterium OttesenSCG-928-E04]MDL2308802.1 LUD domain-containing protein [Bacteroidales bacterium OttesenSCG-928-C03]MDL2312080.1 LUD domain-containing protein [Bacteroidales bacterium OttesenSCG-928-B11]MDL2325690.1 LUD domain-containing protein [Bacteroidales bacterium OttesenSCG-928-A14]